MAKLKGLLYRSTYSLAIAYALLASIWILGSDALVTSAFGTDILGLARWQTLKGVAFVAVTASLLAVTTRRYATGLRCLERQVHDRERLSRLGELSAQAAHEFNNVLMACESLLTVVERHEELTDSSRQRATTMHGALKRGARIAHEMLRFAKSHEPNFRRVDLNEWLAEQIPELAAVAGSAQVRVKRRRDAVMAAIDPDLLSEVLTNLAINAQQAGARVITIAVHRAGNCCSIVFTDDGSGMPPEVRDRAFQPLFTTKKGGTGLGLAIASQIVGRVHGGSLRVDSEPGRGTTFRLDLPAEQAA